MKSSSFNLSLFMVFVIVSANIYGQTNEFARLRSLEKIIENSVKKVNSLITCYDTLITQQKGMSYLVYLHKNNATKSFSFSIDNFPFNKESIDSLTILGYRFEAENIYFVAVDRGLEFNFPETSTKRLSQTIDSCYNRFSNVEGAIVLNFYYLFKFNYRPKKEYVELTYKFYPSLENVPIDEQGLEKAVNSNNVQYSEEAKSGHIFNYCNQFQKLTIEEKQLLYNGDLIVPISD